MKLTRNVALAIAVTLAAGAVVLIAVRCAPSPPIPPAAVQLQAAQVERGKYLVDAGNCFSCHTPADAAPFSGGRSFMTPVGILYAPNITPDRQTGIGKWTLNDFRRAMREGIGAGGYPLFPVFPYPSFTRTSDEDVIAIYAYLQTIKPVRSKPRSNGLLFRQRWGMRLWNALFFKSAAFVQDSTRTQEWNRGAYLVEGLGHCASCHSPRNTFLAEDVSRAFSGGSLQDDVASGKLRRWSSVNLTSAKTGLAAWSLDELTQYLKTGICQRASAFGPMNEVIVNSLSKLNSADIHAMATYLKSLAPMDSNDTVVPAEKIAEGEAIYGDYCKQCHLKSGRGGMFNGPPLAGSAVAQDHDPASLINIILYGPAPPKEVSLGMWETMKPYGAVLNDSEVAAVSNYIRGSWGNRGRAITAKEVAQQR